MPKKMQKTKRNKETYRQREKEGEKALFLDKRIKKNGT